MGPMHGIRVVELAGIGPTPFAGMMMSDLGAEVIRVDRVGGSGNPVASSSGPMERGKRAIGFAGAERIGTEMAKRGWQLDSFPSEELFLGNGGAHCMTCPVWVE